MNINNKRGQIVLFLIMLLVFLLGALFIFYLNSVRAENTSLERVLALSSGNEPLKSFIQNCLQNSVKESISILALSGGYFDRPNLYINDTFYSIPYYYFKGRKTYPNKQDLQQELNKYILLYFDYCINSFEAFNEQGLNFKLGNISIKSDIQDNFIITNLDYPVKAEQNDINLNLNDFRHEQKTKLGILHKKATEISDETINSSSICLSCLSDFAENNNITIEIYQNNDSYIFILQDNLSYFEDEPLKFTFAAKYHEYSCKNLPYENIEFIQQCAELLIEQTNYSLYAEEIPKQTAKAGEKFYYKVNASGFNVSFSDFTDLFDINQDGIIDFTPNQTQIGVHQIWIKLDDILGNSIHDNFELEISE